MTRYAFHDLTLEVEGSEAEGGVELDRILGELSWDRTEGSCGAVHLSLSVRPGEDLAPPPTAREVLRKDGFRGLEGAENFYLTDGASSFCLDLRKGRGEARLAPSFFRKPFLLRQNFWVFALLKLLRPLGNLRTPRRGARCRGRRGRARRGAVRQRQVHARDRSRPPRVALSVRRRRPAALPAGRRRGARAAAPFLRGRNGGRRLRGRAPRRGEAGQRRRRAEASRRRDGLPGTSVSPLARRGSSSSLACRTAGRAP